MYIKRDEEQEFFNTIDDLLNNDTVNQMKKYRQHYDTTTFEHCLNVSFICYKICKKFKLDYISVARAAMLHDLFLYDWRDKREIKHFSDHHAFKHPKIALENATKVISLNEKEKDIILNHMWPVTIMFPRYMETYIMTIVDKYCTILEGINYRKRQFYSIYDKEQEIGFVMELFKSLNYTF